MVAVFKVKDISREIFSVELHAPVTEVAGLMVEKNISCVVVTLNDEPTGIITERDILRKIADKNFQTAQLTAKDIMSTPLVTIELNASVSEAIELMARKKIHRLLATEDDKVVGILTEVDARNTNRNQIANPAQFTSDRVRPVFP